MITLHNRLRAALAGILLALCSGAPALADDSEIYLSTAPSAGVRPNVLLIVDTSLSMDASDSSGERAEYNPNPSTPYATANNCTAGRIFFKVKGAAQPTCTSTNYILATSNNCSKLATATGVGGRSGRWTGKAARFDAATMTWTDLEPSGTAAVIDCLADSGVHGPTVASLNVYARNNVASGYSSLTTGNIEWSTRTTYTFYSAEWLNWYRTTPATSTVRRIQAVENAVVNLVSSVDDINMGMMRFNLRDTGLPGTTDNEYRGGVVTNVIQNIDTGRAGLITSVTNNGAGSSSGSAGYSPNTATMLAETLWEAHQYWSGGTIWSGGTSGRDASIPASGSYTTPISSQCQKNFQIILTDGAPTYDNDADASIVSKAGACTGAPGDAGISGDTSDGRCLDELAGYMHNTTTDLVDDAVVGGDQQVTTYTIGFGSGVNGAAGTFLDEVAADGGGTRYSAANSTDLQAIFDEITADILDVATTFSTASVSVNAFNRTASRNELYFALFAPEDRMRWDGNLKKYKLAVVDPDGSGSPLPPEIVVTGQGTPADAIDATSGFFKSNARSFWSPLPADGNVVTDGGAANKLPVYTSRLMYTHITANPLKLITDAAVTGGMLGLPLGFTATQRTAVLDFMRAKDEKRMGDPMHSVPQVVTYGGTAAAPVDTVFIATNDGVLHAINPDDASGVELWSFVPEELLSRQKQLMDNPTLASRTYGLDGDIKILRYDINSDGVIDQAAGDRVYLYVGMRRGGRYYYALDVTNRTSPSLLWKRGPSQLQGVGETWSPPTIARVNISGATQNGQKFVLIFGGGYDPVQEGTTFANDPTGNRVYIVDAQSGNLLWWAGEDTHATIHPTLPMPSMTNSIPGKISVIDLDGDQLADRMYAADMGGRVFRFDITNGNSAAALVTGGVFANLGQGLATGGPVTVSPGPVIADTRRLYNAPDVTLIQSRGAAPYLSVALGSGYRGHPLSTATIDRFYALRDKQPFRKYTQTEYGDGTVVVITDGDTNLINITSNPTASSVPATAVGWKYEFTANAGEKVLSEATTAGGVVLFTTYQPLPPLAAEPCRSQHRNRTYALNIGNGRPALDFNNDGNITNADLFETVNHDGILGSVNIAVLRGPILDEYKAACAAHTTNPCTNDDPGNQAKLTCITGMHVLGRCVNVGDGGRSYWRKQADAGN